MSMSLDITDGIPPYVSATCPTWFRPEIFENVANISIIVTLGLINVIVIVGNLLVVLAVFASQKLRTITNFLIVSLAVSDLLVGLAVLPYSITLEVLDVWIFGEVWCQVWLAVDVWLCTASILNLCAISIDRYLAITRPMHYRTIMSTKRVKLLILSVWVLSFIICFPPLVGWNDRVKDDEEFAEIANITVYQTNKEILRNFANSSKNSSIDKGTNDFMDIAVYSNSNISDSINSSDTSEDTMYFRKSIKSRCPKPQCGLISNQGYVVYSALGSFYIPMLIMLFFYWKIYVAALKTSRALNRGFKTTRSKTVKNSDNDNLTLRIHRGKPKTDKPASAPNTRPNSSARKQGDILVPRRLPTVVYHHTKDTPSPRCFREGSAKNYYTTTTTTGGLEAPSTSNSRKGFQRTKSTSFSDKEPPAEQSVSNSSSTDHLTVGGEKDGKSSSLKNNLFSRISRRNVRWQAKRFKSEAKATKTVGIIVGGFILCWLPFFTVYLIDAFCNKCISELLFKVFFYLGYCNSALNPIIYGMVSKDFRFAFKKILFRCKLKDDGVSSLIRQIHLPSFFEEEDDAVVTETTSQS